MRLLITLLAFLLIFPAYRMLQAQGPGKTDSLLGALQSANNSSDKFSALILLTRNLQGVNPEQALKYGLEALRIADESLRDEDRLTAMTALTWVYYTKTDYVNALGYAMKSNDLAGKLKMELEQAISLDAIGTIYNDLGDKDKCSEYFFKELKIYERIKDQVGMSQAMSRIGVLYTEMKNYPKALEYLTKALDINKKRNEKIGISSNLNSIANVFAERKEYKKALNYYIESLRIAVEVGDLRREGSNSLSIGSTYLKTDEPKKALEYFMKALRIFHGLNNHLRIARCQVQLGEYYLQSGNLKTGITFADSALEAGQQHGFKDVAYNAADLLRRLHFSNQDLASSYKYAMLESQWKDSIMNGERQKTLTKLETQYQFDKEQSLKAIKQQRRDFVAILLIIVLLALIIILFLVWTRQKVKARNAVLQKQGLEKELEFKKKELVLNVMNLMKKNEVLSDLSEKLIRIEGETSTTESKDTIKKIARELKKYDEEDVWKELSLRFKEVHGDFYNKLLERYPALTPNDLRLCAFLRMNMTSKEIAGLTGQQITSLETARHRLRQKLGISNSDVNLVTFLSQV